MRKKLLSLFAALLLATAGAESAGAAVKYLFLYIGDGMGLPQRQLAEMFRAPGSNGATGRLRMNRLPVQALVWTGSADKPITDSAAAGTAMATGHKTNNAFLGLLPNRKPVPSLAELAHSAGMKVGLVSTAALNDATPAAFYAHTSSREYYEAGLFMPRSGFDYFGGGPLGEPTGKKKDRFSLYTLMKQAGYAVVREDLGAAARVPQTTPLLYLGPENALYEGSPYALDNSRETLRDFVSLGIGRLESAEKGFFIMVEGGKIDWACHLNDAVTAVREVLDFDESLQPALDFASRHPAETLIVLTSDHETGGLSLGRTATRYGLDPAALSGQSVSSEAAYAALMPLIARKAPFEEALAVLDKAYGLGQLSDTERQQLKAAWSLSLTPFSERKKDKAFTGYGSYDPTLLTCHWLLCSRAGIGWSTVRHTAAPVALSACGAGAEKFAGFYENTEIFTKMKAALGLETVTTATSADSKTVSVDRK